MPDRFLTPVPPPDGEADEPALCTRLAWFLGLSLASAGVVMIAAYTLRSLLFLE